MRYGLLPNVVNRENIKLRFDLDEDDILDGIMLETGRLRMVGWREEHREPFARMNADPRVMEFFPKLMTREESDAMVERIQGVFEERGFGLWVLELKETGEFLGFTGLGVPRFEAWFTPCVEMGWRLVPEAWGKGYASEAARRAMAFGFEEAGVEKIFSFTATVNVRSERVMQRLGMERLGTFEHPLVAEGSVLREHVLYVAGRE